MSKLGDLLADPADGAIDNFYDFAWAGRPLDFFIGGPDFAFADHGRAMRLVLGEPSFEDDVITLPLRDIAASLDVEIQTRRYGGTGGPEGQGEVRDKLKPDANCPHVQPPDLGLDAKGRHTFGLGSGPIVGVGTYPIRGGNAPPELFDGGSPLFYTADPASPQPGEYVVDVETATLTLGGAFQGTVQANLIDRRYLSIASTSTHTISGGMKTFVVPPFAFLTEGEAQGAAYDVQASLGLTGNLLVSYDPAEGSAVRQRRTLYGSPMPLDDLVTASPSIDYPYSWTLSIEEIIRCVPATTSNLLSTGSPTHRICLRPLPIPRTFRGHRMISGSCRIARPPTGRRSKPC